MCVCVGTYGDMIWTGIRARRRRKLIRGRHSSKHEPGDFVATGGERRRGLYLFFILIHYINVGFIYIYFFFYRRLRFNYRERGVGAYVVL